MQEKWKSLLHKSSHRKRNSQSHHAKYDPGNVTSDARDTKASRLSVGHGGSNDYRSPGDTSPRPLSVRRDPTVAATDYGTPNFGDIDNAVADDYRAYLPAISPRTEAINDDSRYMSLGGDTRHLSGTSESKHGEDIADRNIEMYGSSSRHGSLPSQKGVELAQDTIDHLNQAASTSPKHSDGEPRRKSATSNTSAGSMAPTASVKSTNSRYALGTGVPTEGGLVDRILPHKESTHTQKFNRKDWPTRVDRNDAGQNQIRRKPVGNSDDDVPGERSRSRRGSVGSSLLDDAQPMRDDGLMDFRSAVMDGPVEFRRRDSDRSLGLNGAIDVSNTEDVDKSTRIAPAVVHEVVKPHEHEIIEERIYREIHNHDVYHRIQPVLQTEILPARHYVHDANGNLVEVTEDQIAERTGEFQQWYIGKMNSPVVQSPRVPRITKPTVVKDIKYMTPEGFERRETTIVHPPELEDLSGYGGPVVPIEFLHDTGPSSADLRNRNNKAYNHLGDAQPLSLRELTASLPEVDGPSQTIRLVQPSDN